jgi:hypothetical protein
MYSTYRFAHEKKKERTAACLPCPGSRAGPRRLPSRRTTAVSGSPPPRAHRRRGKPRPCSRTGSTGRPAVAKAGRCGEGLHRPHGELPIHVERLRMWCWCFLGRSSDGGRWDPARDIAEAAPTLSRLPRRTSRRSSPAPAS